MSAVLAANDAHFSSANKMLVTMRVDGQLFGISVQNVQDVLKEQKVARVPLAPAEVAGSLNLRGRIVTVIDLRQRLRLGQKQDSKPHMFVVVEYHDELYSLMVDSVGDVMNVSLSTVEKNPANLSANWRDVSDGICRLQNELLVIIDISRLLTLKE